jgi:hypothetical protein
MNRKLGIAAVIVVLLIAVSLAIDRAVLTDEEALDLLWEELVQALPDEDGAAVGRLFLDQMTYRGPRPMGEGDRQDALTGLQRLWEIADRVKITSEREILVQGGSIGVIKAGGHLRFAHSEGTVLYKMTTEVTAVKADGQWKVQSIQVSELNPGLF